MAYSIHDPDGASRSVDMLSEERIQPESINLALVQDAPVDWHILDAFSGLEVQERGQDWGWTLENGRTFYLRTAGELDSKFESSYAFLVFPDGKSTLPVQDNQHFQLQTLAASHRCTGTIFVEVLDSGSRIIETHCCDVDSRKTGGKNEAGHQRVFLPFRTPLRANALRIGVKKSKAVRGDDSYLFVSQPSLVRVPSDVTAPVDPITLPSDLRQRVYERSVEIVRAKFRLSEAPLTTAKETLAITISDGANFVTSNQLFVPVSDILVINTLTIEHRQVNVSGVFTDNMRTHLQLGVFVDGIQSASKILAIEGGAFSASFLLSNDHLDGLVHAIEIRLIPEQVCLAFSYEMLPYAITPWNALLSYAGSPLDITRSPAAQHHFRSFAAWAEALTENTGEEAHIPPLRYLHGRLLAGFDSKSKCLPFSFPVWSKPDVSIIVPVHNKFNITYFCLCALRFAFNNAAFEVIIVDDGSSDETTRIEEIIGGIQVVRNPTPLGFVRACNVGSAKARGKYIAFLNNDTEVTAGWLDELLAAFDCFSDVGLVGSKLVYPNGKLQEAGGIVWRSGNPWNVGRNGNPLDPAFNYVRQVDYISGAAILLPLDLWESVGRFSEEFAPAYFEDTDLAMKVWNCGRRVLYVPMSTVFHYEGQSAGTNVASGMKRFQEVNRPKFKRKWSKLYLSHGVEGQMPEKEKDRNVSFRVLFVDQRFPHVDEDAGSYAAFQEMRLMQA